MKNFPKTTGIQLQKYLHMKHFESIVVKSVERVTGPYELELM